MAWAAAFGASLGLAVLAKGPAAILLAGGSTALWALVTGNLRRSFRLLHPAAIGAFLLVALPWYARCAALNPDFLRIFFLEHNVERFVTNRYQHQQPFWFFVPILLLSVFPWTLLLIPAAMDGWRALRAANWRQSPGVYFSSWVIIPFLFFSASQSKLPGYILPAIPPLVLLLARAVVGDESSPVPLARDRLLLVAAALAALGAVAAIRSGANLPSPAAQQPLRLVGMALICGAGIVVMAGAWRSLRQSAAMASLVISFAVGLAANHVLPALDAQISPRAVAIQAQGLPPLCQTYHLTRSWQYGLEFYLRGPVKDWSAGEPRPLWIITDDVGRAQLTAQGWPLVAHGPETPRATLFRVGLALGTW
jgi:4-amino-4-deoxy-L-arabinose transferase-like glycosyltransferase